MHSVINKPKNSRSRKGKKLIKLINDSDSDSDSSIHELSYYLDDRVKLIKEVLKIIKPKKIRSMAPNCMKDLDNEEINSMLLEELLGISNKRLKCIFEGKILEEDSSSTDSEVEQKSIDIISLDDISDDDFVIIDSDDRSGEKIQKAQIKIKVKEEPTKKKLKIEKREKNYSLKKTNTGEQDPADAKNLMSVLELLELQARARAIRSQLALEKQSQERAKDVAVVESDGDEAIIIESPKIIEILITSTDESENEHSRNNKNTEKFIHKKSHKNKSSEKSIHFSSPSSTNNVEEGNKIISEISVFDDNSVSELTKAADKVLNYMESEEQLQDKITAKKENSKITNVRLLTSFVDVNPNQSEESDGDIETNVNKKSCYENANDITNVNSEVTTVSFKMNAAKIRNKNSTKKSGKYYRRKCGHYRKHNTDDSGDIVLQNNVKTLPEFITQKNVNEVRICLVSDINVSNSIENDGKILDGPKTKACEFASEESVDILQQKSSNLEDGDGIVINVDQSEMDCIISD